MGGDGSRVNEFMNVCMDGWMVGWALGELEVVG